MKIERVGIGISLLLMVIIALMVFGSMDNSLRGASEESLQQKEEAIRRAAVQAYALEGSYPPDLDYLETHYGLILNREAYFYHYEIIGSNIMPQIGVYHRWN